MLTLRPLNNVWKNIMDHTIEWLVLCLANKLYRKYGWGKLMYSEI